MFVRLWMHEEIFTTHPGEPLEKVAATMRKHKIGGIPVVVQNKLVGIITESDIFQALIEILGGNAEGVRIEMSIGSKADAMHKTLDLFQEHEMFLLNLTVCNDCSADGRMLTIRFRGEDIDALIDDLWRAGCKINSIIREDLPAP